MRERDLFKYLLFFLFTFNLYALEVSLLGAKENFTKYSTLHLKDKTKFLCQETKNDFDEITEIVCAFSKQPTNKFRKLQNDFFHINSFIKNKTFFIIIKPIKKIKLYPIIFNLVKDDTIFDANVKLSKHWMIVGYKEKLPFIRNDKKPDVAINFPFSLSSDNLPFVGGLDLKGNPVYIKKVQDVTDYLKIKKLYENKKYEKCLNLIDEIIQEYPNSLFNAEFLFYKIRVYSKMDDFDNVIELSKVFLREYSSDENVPEVLALTAKGYSKIGMNSDADYFFDRVFTEHEDSPYTKWAYIYKGEMLEESGGASKALSFYTKALLETQDIDIAATAAYKLAQYYNDSNIEESAKYIRKIIKAKPNFFMNDYFTAMEMMYNFVESGDFEIGAAMAQAFLDEIDNKHDDYEKLLYEKAIWLSKLEDKQVALKALNDYLTQYKYGSYEDLIIVAKDSLFLDLDDGNTTAKLIQYDELIQTYTDDSIGDRALYEKAKLLLESGMYSDILDIKDSILALDNEKYTDTQDIIITSAIGAMKDSLKNKECQTVINISADYNITLSNEWDEGIYDCAMMGGDFLLSKNIAGKNLKSKDLSIREKWLYRYIKVDFETGNYSDVIDASKELILLIEDDKDSQYKEVYRFLFDTYQRLEDKDKMIESIVDVEKNFGFTYKDIDRFVSMISVASDKKDDNMLIKYAKAVVKMQNESSSYVQSPYIEFTLYQSYINKEMYNDAMEIIKSLDKIELSPAKRARQKYLLGTIYTKLWREDDAKVAYQESIDADETSSWAKLAKDAKEI